MAITNYSFKKQSTMKKQKAFGRTSWIYYITTSVLTLSSLAVSVFTNHLTVGVVLIIGVIFTVGMACAIHYRTDDY
jgi:hypothetical protein